MGMKILENGRFDIGNEYFCLVEKLNKKTCILCFERNSSIYTYLNKAVPVKEILNIKTEKPTGWVSNNQDFDQKRPVICVQETEGFVYIQHKNKNVWIDAVYPFAI